MFSTTPETSTDSSVRALLVARNRQHLEELIDRASMWSGIHADLNHIDVTGIQDLSGLFMNKQFEGSVANWDVSNATNMGQMFKGSTFHGNLSGWTFSPLLRQNGLDQCFSQMSAANLSKLLLPPDMPATVGTLFRRSVVIILDDWLTACMKDPARGVVRYHWDALLEFPTGPMAWCTQEMREHAALWRPLHEGLGLSTLEEARSLHKQWLSRFSPTQAASTLPLPGDFSKESLP